MYALKKITAQDDILKLAQEIVKILSKFNIKYTYTGQKTSQDTHSTQCLTRFAKFTHFKSIQLQFYIFFQCRVK